MAVNRGKSFEGVVQAAFEKVDGVSVDRLHDQTTGYQGSTNICDFIVYRKPYQLYIECKSVHGNTLSIHSIPKPDRHGVLHGFYGNITDKQWEGLLEKSKIRGVTAGVMIWWVDKDVTKFIPIQILKALKRTGNKSVRYDIDKYIGNVLEIKGKKKRVFFDYDMDDFLHQIDKEKRREV